MGGQIPPDERSGGDVKTGIALVLYDGSNLRRHRPCSTREKKRRKGCGTPPCAPLSNGERTKRAVGEKPRKRKGELDRAKFSNLGKQRSSTDEWFVPRKKKNLSSETHKMILFRGTALSANREANVRSREPEKYTWKTGFTDRP